MRYLITLYHFDSGDTQIFATNDADDAYDVASDFQQAGNGATILDRVTGETREFAVILTGRN